MFWIVGKKIRSKLVTLFWENLVCQIWSPSLPASLPASEIVVCSRSIVLKFFLAKMPIFVYKND
jgi:hypothetical protein